MDILRRDRPGLIIQFCVAAAVVRRGNLSHCLRCSGSCMQASGDMSQGGGGGRVVVVLAVCGAAGVVSRRMVPCLRRARFLFATRNHVRGTLNVRLHVVRWE